MHPKPETGLQAFVFLSRCSSRLQPCTPFSNNCADGAATDELSEVCQEAEIRRDWLNWWCWTRLGTKAPPVWNLEGRVKHCVNRTLTSQPKITILSILHIVSSLSIYLYLSTFLCTHPLLLKGQCCPSVRPPVRCEQPTYIGQLLKRY